MAECELCRESAVRFTLASALGMIMCFLSQTAGCALVEGERFGLSAIYNGRYDTYEKIAYENQIQTWSYLGYLSAQGVSSEPIFSNASKYFPDNRKKIPEKVTLVWLSAPTNASFSSTDQLIIEALPKPSSSQITEKSLHPYPYPPKVYGPYQIEVRSKIPKEVLSLAANGDFGVGITIEFTETHQKIYWRVQDYRSEKYRDPLKPILCVGGDGIASDSKQTAYKLTDVDPDSLMQKTVPIWPHCKLP